MNKKFQPYAVAAFEVKAEYRFYWSLFASDIMVHFKYFVHLILNFFIVVVVGNSGELQLSSAMMSKSLWPTSYLDERTNLVLPIMFLVYMNILIIFVKVLSICRADDVY